MLVIPFTILPPQLVVRLARPLKGAGNFLAALFPSLKVELLQSEIELPAREYAAVGLVVGVTNFIVIYGMIAIIGYATAVDLLFLSLASGLVVGSASFFTVMFYPKILSIRRTRALDSSLIPALRQLLIDLRSGVPLFQAMTSVASGYGEVSYEFRKMVKQMNAGMSQAEVLSEASRRIPSFKFRRIIWQINNALKVGSDVGTALEVMIDELTAERIDEIRRYGQELNPWIMIYMIAAVVVPSLGLTMLIVVLSFLNIPVPKLVFPAVWILLLAFHIFFISFVKTRRPAVEN